MPPVHLATDEGAQPFNRLDLVTVLTKLYLRGAYNPDWIQEGGE